MTNAEVAEALDALTIEDDILTRLKRLKDPGARGMLPTEDARLKADGQKELPRSGRPKDPPAAQG